jgi:thioester reductase-like protein
MSKILLTGATGYIGAKLLRELVQQDDRTVLVPIRSLDDEGFAKRKSEVLSKIPAELQERLQFVRGDLGTLSESLGSETNAIDQIIHNAAVTAFNVEEDVANTINRDGTIQMMQLARRCNKLEKFLYVSTVYTSGTTAEAVSEKFFVPKPSFANHYERSKWEAEEALRTEFMDLPWNIARVATVIADNQAGLVVQQNAIHNTLKLFYYGLISLVPGFKTTPIYLVEGDFVAKSLNALSQGAPAQKIYHVCHDSSCTVTLGKFMDIAFDEFSKDELFRSRRLLKPLFTDEKSFDTLVTNMKSFGGSVLSQGLSSVAPFGKQLFIKKDIQNEVLLSFIKDYERPDMEAIVAKACRYLAETKFTKAT